MKMHNCKNSQHFAGALHESVYPLIYRFNCKTILTTALLLVLPITFTPNANADSNDNLLAHDLFKQQRYAEAAEIFTDPAWKGVALYRSSQWWRAAEAFVRADDADSLFNLGNSYVQLGYYELALDAYLGATSKRNGFTDAEFNADLMRQILSQDNEGESQGLLKPGADEIEQLESGDDETGSGKEGDEGSDDKPDKKQGDDREGDTDSRGPSPDATAGGDSSESGSDKTPGQQEPDTGGNVKGTESEPTQEQSPASASEGKNEQLSDVTAGVRTELESEQATVQWLNQIQNNPDKFLKAQIALEAKRRKAAGQSPPAGGSQW